MSNPLCNQYFHALVDRMRSHPRSLECIPEPRYTAQTGRYTTGPCQSSWHGYHNPSRHQGTLCVQTSLAQPHLKRNKMTNKPGSEMWGWGCGEECQRAQRNTSPLPRLCVSKISKCWNHEQWGVFGEGGEKGVKEKPRFFRKGVGRQGNKILPFQNITTLLKFRSRNNKNSDEKKYQT